MNEIIVIIPAFNNESLVEFTLSNSSFCPLTDVVILDSSNSSKIKKIAKHYECKYLVIENKGRVENWNAGIDYSLKENYKYFKFLFAGDVLNKGIIRRYIEEFQSDDEISFITGSYGIVDKSNQTRQISHVSETTILASEVEKQIFNRDKGNWFGPPSAQAYRSSKVGSLRFNSFQPWTADWLFALSLSNSNKVLLLKDDVCRFYESNRLTYNSKANTLASKIEEINVIRTYCENDECLILALSKKLPLKIILKLLFKKVHTKIVS
ncbi:glycosyltransferase family A protein [Shewanella glacialipiscicola]|uniref:glycosyltransferase family A protein n=1 Tax=Shewanella glacialipiscicola TaxID=614069 RepID=UPI003D7B3C8C